MLNMCRIKFCNQDSLHFVILDISYHQSECSFPLRNPADGYLVVSQEISGCDLRHSFRYYIQAWLALPITTCSISSLMSMPKRTAGTRATSTTSAATAKAKSLLLPNTWNMLQIVSSFYFIPTLSHIFYLHLRSMASSSEVPSSLSALPASFWAWCTSNRGRERYRFRMEGSWPNHLQQTPQTSQ